jgi:hypothetical protein
MQPSAEQSEKLQSEHVRHAVEAIPTKARPMRVAGKGPLPATHRPVHQREPAKAFDRVSQRGERTAQPRAHLVQGRSLGAVGQMPDTPLQQKLPEGPMRSLAQLLDEGSIRLGATSERRADPAITRAMQVQQAIDSEHVGQAAPVDRPALPMQPVNPLASVPGGQGVASDVRGAVLSEVLARSPEGAPADSRTTMITARGLTALASQRGGTLAIRLDPPSLGEVAIRMSVIDGVVRAELTAASSAARALMEKGIEFLRASLESRGLTVERLSVQGPIATSESHSARSESQQGGTREEGMNEDHHDAAGHESRGRGGEQRSRSSDGHEDSRGARNSFKQVLAEDTT